MPPEIYLSSDEKNTLMNSGDDAANSLYGIASAGALTSDEITTLTTNITADKL
jgi:hypothetical protein